MTSWNAFAKVVAPIILCTASGCLASKGDIRLLQDELRASRQQSATGDAAIMRADTLRRQQIAVLSATLDRMLDSQRVVSARLASFQATVNGQMDVMGEQLVKFQALLGQTTRNVQDARAQLEALKEQGIAGAAAASAPPSTDTSHRAGAANGLPGPATLFTSANDQLKQGSYRTALRGFDQLLSTYPDYEQAPLAQLHVGDAYGADGNTAAADSVYQLVATKYPKSDEAATGLYKHGKFLWDSNKKPDARVVLQRVIKDYPGSSGALLAKDLLGR
ncbi:MAG: tetratricopeptide repeat protein [bacterium]